MPEGITTFERGDVVALRSIREFAHHGLAVGFAVAGIVLVDSNEFAVVATTPGSDLRTRVGRGSGPNDRLVLAEDWDGTYEERRWSGNTVVRVHRWGDEWSVWRWHDGTAWLDQWYGNLEAPWRRSESGFDTQDWVLDVVGVGTPGTASWAVHDKDADELAWLVARGTVSAERARHTRDAGSRLTALARSAAWPFDADWDRWRPPRPAAEVALPPGWTHVGSSASGGHPFDG